MLWVQVITLPLLERSSFGDHSLSDDLLLSSIIDIGGRDIIEGLMQPVVVVMRDEPADGFFQFTGQVVMIELHHILHRAMITLDLPLGLRMVGRSSSMLHLAFLQIRFKFLRHITWAVV